MRRGIGIVVALAQEAAPLRRALRGRPDILVACSGMGRARAARAAAALCEQGDVGMLIAAGFAAALSPKLQPGDLLWAESVLEVPDAAPGAITRRFQCEAGYGGHAKPLRGLHPVLNHGATLRNATEAGCRRSQPPSGGFLGVAGRFSAWSSRAEFACKRSEFASHQPRAQRTPCLHVAPLATTDALLATTIAKRAFASSLAAGWEGSPPSAVDMESAGVAEVAAQRGLPFAAVRAISDGFEEELPLDFARCAGRDGQIRSAAVMAELLRHPTALPGLLRLGRNSRAAAERLSAFLADVLCGG